MAQPLVFKRVTARRFYSGFIVTLILGFLFSVVMSVFAAGTLTIQVYLDSDRDGTFDSGETGISGILVSVYSAESVIVGLNTTDSNGQVVFPSLPDGNYRIEVSNLGARVVSVPGNDNPGLLSFVTISGGAVTQRIGLRELDGGSIDTGAPVGTRSISVRVWDDSDADGIQDAGEPSLSGLPVRLVDSLGNLVSGPVNTDALGRATFNNAPTGAGYRVRILAADIPSGYILTQAFVNDGDPNPTIRDSNAVLVSGNVEATLPSTGRGVNIDSVDIGFTRGAVSGFLWRDNDRDGLWDSGEPRLNGVTVQLVNTSTSTVISTTTTRQRIGSTQPEDGGIFVFPSLPLTTTYRVVIPNSQFASGAPLFGAANSLSFAGGDVGSPDGIPGTNDVTGPVLTVNATTNVYSNQRFGFYKGVVGDFVWLDDDSDGNQDTGEIGVNGVIVFVDADNDGIRDSGELFTVTTNNPNNGQPGYYLFDDLPLGSSYRITLDPDNFKAGGALVGLGNSTGTAATNGNGDFYVYQVSSTLNEASPQNIIIDFGLYQLAQISGQVFFDGANAPADNVASGEPGVGSVTVRLRDGSDAIITTTTTLADGTFTISNVALGTYRLEFVNPDATNFSFVAADTADNRVASIVSDNGRTALFTVNASNQSIVRSAALIGKSTVNGITFVDQAYDGQRDTGDPRLANVAVNLTATVALPNLNTTITRSATTDSSGNYSFGGLPGGTGAVTFTLSFTPPPATPPYQVTQADVGADATDSDGAADLTNQPLGVGTTASRDQGYYQNVTVQARVFHETVTINNTFESGEAGLRAVTVNVSGPTSSSQATDLSGLVTFSGPPGVYTFTIPTDPSGYIRSPGNTGTASTALVLSGATAPAVPFGYYRPAQINGTVWFDTNSNGIFDSGEPGMENVSVRLTGNNSGPGTPVTTNSSGAFTISGIEPTGLTNSSYQLCFTAPTGFFFTSKGDTLTTDNNSDANPSGCSDSFTIASGANIGYIDAGLRGTLSIGDLIWEDANGNGIQDSGEQALENVTITIQVQTNGGVINSSNPSFTFTTTSTGGSGLSPNYSIGNIPPGSTVTIQAVSRFGYLLTTANQGGDQATDSNAVGSSFTLTANDATIDFGLYRTTAIGNLVWYDVNGNGVRDTGEPGIPNLTIALRDAAGNTITSTQTLGDGSYAFSNLTPGSYSLRLTIPAGYTTTNNGSGSIGTDDDNDFRTDGTTVNFVITSGQALGGVDAGLRGIGSVSGIAWFDTNENNVRDASETDRVSGVRVTITFTPTLLPALPQILQVATDTNGAYNVTNLPPGEVAVVFTNLAGYLPAQPNVGGDDTIDSDGPVVSFTLGAGQNAVVDMGYYRRVLVYLPLTMVQVPPDLIVSIQATPANPNLNTPVTYQITVTNVGREPASNFWVDLYVNPRKPPEVNERWNDLSRQGLAWFFAGTLQPGESVTLNSRPRSSTNPYGYDPATSSPTWNGRLPPGRNTIYVYVDSWNRDESGNVRSPFGAVEEVNETNNRAEITIVVSE